MLLLLVSPIDCSRKLRKRRPHPGSHKPGHVAKGHKQPSAPGARATANRNHTAAPLDGHLRLWTMVVSWSSSCDMGGACGYRTAVGKQPFDSMIAAGSTLLYRGGEGCGACYEVKCTSNEACSGQPATIVITDQSPGGLFPGEIEHFDMSGTSMGAMAKPGMADKLRAGGVLRIQYRRVACKYTGVKIAFKVDQGANPFYFDVLIEFEDDDGDLSAVELMEAGSHTWTPMSRNWGAMWRLNNGRKLNAPFALQLTSDSGRVLVANNAIPAAWKPGKTYRSLVNYP
ncbi:hypothetical protein PR202_ga25456 [Eleusine coracana subsp. coracana]|uniref:Uncharacterized protein n=1 Tax=Eleusine coracana subsp. coracana TaxID=191504 RepID=A0AAV5DB65_ELECO|nr:hypothetical protein PR202_ga25396 [Eleusine coracana subsp. coracana]GJN07613.1 hypothetical protein PR202_ga25456 [Eleusine coracana subsp. coracana]